MKKPPFASPPAPPALDKGAHVIGSFLAADVISAQLAPPVMAEPAQRLLAAISRRDAAELDSALRVFESKVMLDPAVSAYGGRWLLGVARTHVPGLPDLIRIESLLGEMKGGGEALSFWVAQVWAATDGGQTKLLLLAETMIASWREVHTEAAIRFGCALTTSLSVIQTKLAARLMSRIETVSPAPKSAAATIEHAAAWVDVGCILTQLSPAGQMLIEERLASPERVGEWSSPGARQALEELRPHLGAPSKAAKLFQAILPADAWPDMDEQGMHDHPFGQTPVSSGTPPFAPQVEAPPGSPPARQEPVRLLVLVTIMFVMTVVYSVVNAHRRSALNSRDFPGVSTIVSGHAVMLAS